MLKNEHNMIICDSCSNILSDGVTLLPGYLSVDGGRVYEYRSIDPNNAHDVEPMKSRDPRLDLPRNRLTGNNGEDYVVSKIIVFEGVDPKVLKDGDYCNKLCATS